MHTWLLTITVEEWKRVCILGNRFASLTRDGLALLLAHVCALKKISFEDFQREHVCSLKIGFEDF